MYSRFSRTVEMEINSDTLNICITYDFLVVRVFHRCHRDGNHILDRCDPERRLGIISASKQRGTYPSSLIHSTCPASPVSGLESSSWDNRSPALGRYSSCSYDTYTDRDYPCRILAHAEFPKGYENLPMLPWRYSKERQLLNRPGCRCEEVLTDGHQWDQESQVVVARRKWSPCGGSFPPTSRQFERSANGVLFV